MIPAGTYRAVIDGSVQFGKSSKGTEQLAATFRITRGDQEGQTIGWYGFLSEQTWERTFESLRFCGWVGDDLSRIGQLPNEVEIVVEHEVYEGKTRAKVRWVNGGGGRAAMKNAYDETDTQRLADKWRAKASRIKPVEGAPPPAASEPDDDIPF